VVTEVFGEISACGQTLTQARISESLKSDPGPAPDAHSTEPTSVIKRVFGNGEKTEFKGFAKLTLLKFVFSGSASTGGDARAHILIAEN